MGILPQACSFVFQKILVGIPPRVALDFFHGNLLKVHPSFFFQKLLRQFSEIPEVQEEWISGVTVRDPLERLSADILIQISKGTKNSTSNNWEWKPDGNFRRYILWGTFSRMNRRFLVLLNLRLPESNFHRHFCRNSWIYFWRESQKYQGILSYQYRSERNFRSNYGRVRNFKRYFRLFSLRNSWNCSGRNQRFIFHIPNASLTRSSRNNSQFPNGFSEKNSRKYTKVFLKILWTEPQSLSENNSLRSFRSSSGSWFGRNYGKNFNRY